RPVRVPLSRVAAGAPPPTLRRAVCGRAARGTPRPAAREGVRRLGHHHADGARAARHDLLQPRRARARGADRAAHPGRSAPRRRRPGAAGRGARPRRDLVARAGGPHLLDAEGFQPSVTHAILSGADGIAVDRVYTPRIVAFAPLGDGGERIVAVVYRGDFEGELDTMLHRGLVVFLASLVLALA